MTLSPVKTCDHCGKVGIMSTFSDGETICAECNFSLPISSRECRREIVKLRAALTNARDVFLRYANIHAAKSPPDYEKADLNRKYAQRCEEALK